MFNIKPFEQAIVDDHFEQTVLQSFPDAEGWAQLIQSPATQSESLRFLAAHIHQLSAKKALSHLVWNSLGNEQWRTELTALLVTHIGASQMWSSVMEPLLDRHWRNFSYQRNRADLLIKHVIPHALPTWSHQEIHSCFFRYIEPTIEHPKRPDVFSQSSIPDNVLAQSVNIAIEQHYIPKAKELVERMTPKGQWVDGAQRVILREDVVEQLVRPQDVYDLLHLPSVRILYEHQVSLYERQAKADLDQLYAIAKRLPDTAEYANAILDVVEWWEHKDVLYYDGDDANLPWWKTFIQQLHSRVDHAEISVAVAPNIEEHSNHVRTRKI